MKNPFVLSLLCLLALSCNKGSGLLYRTTVMGSVDESGVFRDDAGWRYDFMDAQPEFTQPREVICCDVFRVDEEARSYAVTLRSLYHPVYKQAVIRSETPEWQGLGADPVRLTALWYSGGCLNMTFQLRYGSQALAHDINLVYDDVDSDEKRICLYLKHNAQGDSDGNTANLDASFPLARLLPPVTENLVLELHWYWGGLSRTSKLVLP